MTWTIRPRSDVGALRAIRAGSGPRVLLLHGVGLRAEAWSAQIDAFADRYEVIAPDMPGHGEAPAFDHKPKLCDYVDHVAALLDEPAFIVGHSMGAMIALELASRHPASTRAVAALNAIFRRTPAASQAVQRRAAALDEEQPVDPTATVSRWFGADGSAERDACRAWLGDVDPRAYKAAYTVFAAEDGPTDAALAAIEAPALFLTGGDEPNSTPAMSETMAARAAGGRAVVIDGAAHMAPMTHASAVNAALLSFFEESCA